MGALLTRLYGIPNTPRGPSSRVLRYGLAADAGVHVIDNFNPNCPLGAAHSTLHTAGWTVARATTRARLKMRSRAVGQWLRLRGRRISTALRRRLFYQMRGIGVCGAGEELREHLAETCSASSFPHTSLVYDGMGHRRRGSRDAIEPVPAELRRGGASTASPSRHAQGGRGEWEVADRAPPRRSACGSVPHDAVEAIRRQDRRQELVRSMSSGKHFACVAVQPWKQARRRSTPATAHPR